MRQLIDQQSRTAQERAELQAALDKEAEDRKIIELQKAKLAAKLKVSQSISFIHKLFLFLHFCSVSAALNFIFNQNYHLYCVISLFKIILSFNAILSLTFY